jgi:hypothetical protein
VLQVVAALGTMPSSTVPKDEVVLEDNPCFRKVRIGGFLEPSGT